MCVVAGCPTTKTVGRGLCRKHYLREYRTGDASTPPQRIRGDDEARYWSKVDRRGPDECWPWTAHSRKGYGLMRVAGVLLSAHRWAYERWIGPIPTGLQVCHSCDNPPCQNPAHWFLGTNDDNVADKMAKGRAPTRLTAAQVGQMRRLYKTGRRQVDLARSFGVTPSHVSRIVRGINRRYG